MTPIQFQTINRMKHLPWEALVLANIASFNLKICQRCKHSVPPDPTIKSPSQKSYLTLHHIKYKHKLSIDQTQENILDMIKLYVM